MPALFNHPSHPLWGTDGALFLVEQLPTGGQASLVASINRPPFKSVYGGPSYGIRVTFRAKRPKYEDMAC